MSLTISASTNPSGDGLGIGRVFTLFAERKLGLKRSEAELFAKLVQAMGADGPVAYDLELKGMDERLVRELLADNPPPLEVNPDLPGEVGL